MLNLEQPPSRLDRDTTTASPPGGSRLFRRLGRGTVALALSALVLASAAQPVAATAGTASNASLPTFTERHIFHPVISEGTTGGILGEASALAGRTAAYVAERTYASKPGAGPHRQTVRVAVASDSSDERWDEYALTPPDPGPQTYRFGAAVAVSPDGQTVYVTSPIEERVYAFSSGPAGDWSGAPTVYDAPEPPARVRYSGVSKDTYRAAFGESMDTDGASIVLGVPNAGVDGISNVGMVWHLDLASGAWRALLPPAESRLDNTILGQAVSVSGDLIAAGLPQGRSTDGTYMRIGGVALWSNGADVPKIITQPALDTNECILKNDGSGPAFGMSVGFVNRTLFVGSPWEVRVDEGYPCTASSVMSSHGSQGAVYRFDESLAQIGPKLIPQQGYVSYGRTIGVDGNTLMVFTETPWSNATGNVFVYGIDKLTTGQGGGAQFLEPAQSLLPAGYTGENFGAFEYGTGIAISGKRALFASGNSDGYLFSEIAPPQPDQTLSLAEARHTYGEAGTLLASLEEYAVQQPPGASAEPGSVEFFVGSQSMGSAPLVQGVATLTLPAAAVPAAQDIPISATTTTARGPLTAESMLHVDPAPTTTRVTSVKPVSDGTGWRLNGTVTSAFGTIPTGQIDLGESSLTAPLADGKFSVVLPAKAAKGAAKATVRYLGDGNHLASEQGVDLPALTPHPTKPPKGGKDNDSPLSRTGAADGPVTMAAVAALLLAVGGTAFLVSRRKLGSHRD